MTAPARTIQKEQRYLYLASGFLLLLFVTYMYLISSTVAHVVVRKEVDKKITAMHSEISQLETAYIKAQHAVSADIASLQGYKETKEKIFIDRTPSTLVLGSNI